MKSRINELMLAYLTVLLLSGIVAAEEKSEDEAAILLAMQSYIDAFNRGDAAALADHWSDSGEWVSPSGDRFHGRDAIRAEMEDYFAEASDQQIEVNNPTIRILAPTVAIEEGTAVVTRPGEMPHETSYIAIHTKSSGVWKLDSVRETVVPSAPSNYEFLKELEWMIGTWSDQDDNAIVETTCAWTKNRNFMTRSFKVMVEDRIDVEGTQVLGWDPVAEKIRSWVFDSSGGFGTGVWTRDGDRWIVKASHIFHDGSKGSTIRILTWIDDDRFTLHSTSREIDGELMPDIGPVTIVRAS